MLQTELCLFIKIGAEVAVLSWKNFYCHGTTAQFHNQETATLRMSQIISRSFGKIGAEITVISCNNFYCQGTTALFHNQETAPLRIRQTELSLSWQGRC
jgi:hypothetical protein